MNHYFQRKGNSRKMRSSCHERGIKKKHRVPIKNRTLNLPIQRSIERTYGHFLSHSGDKTEKTSFSNSSPSS